MLIIMSSGRLLFEKIPWLTRSLANIQKIFGVLMILTSLGIYFNWDRQIQSYLIEKYPGWGTNLTSIEDNQRVNELLNKIETKDDDSVRQNLNLNKYPIAPNLVGTGEWFNSEPLQISKLKGKVVLVDFWTYTCINCIRTLPYLKSWDEKYRSNGLVIIGVHTPEFAFEKNAQNLQKAINDYEIKYPIVQDNDFKTWDAFSNRYWPAKYLIDKDGRIRYTHFGEGDYDETENMIQTLLKEAGEDISLQKLKTLNTTYILKHLKPIWAYWRISNFMNINEIRRDQTSQYKYKEGLYDNYYDIQGDWVISKEYSQPSVDSSLKLKFNSKDVYLVASSEMDTEAEIYLDGNLISNEKAGVDVSDGKVNFKDNRIYHLIGLDKPRAHILEIKFLGSDAKIFAFTFG